MAAVPTGLPETRGSPYLEAVSWTSNQEKGSQRCTNPAISVAHKAVTVSESLRNGIGVSRRTALRLRILYDPGDLWL